MATPASWRGHSRASPIQLPARPRPQVSIASLDRAERIARSVGDWRALSYAFLSRSSARELSGELELALADRRLAVQAAERSGEIERLAFAYHEVADTYLEMGVWEEGRAAARTGLALDPQAVLKALPGGAHLSWMEGRPREALEEMAAFTSDARRRGDLQGLSMGLAWLADMALQLDRPADAEAPAREAAELLRVGGGWLPWPGVGCGPLAETAVLLATFDVEDTLAAAEQMVASTEQHAARPQLLRARGLLLQRQGDLDAALEALAASAEIARSQHACIQLGRTLASLADAARQRGDAALAAEAEAELAKLVDSIGPEVSVLAWARSVGPAARRLAVSPAHGRSAPGPLGMLTLREREVAVLVARGLTNRQIADALAIADGTAGVHIDHILNKLGFRSRAQVAAWAVEHGLLAAATD